MSVPKKRLSKSRTRSRRSHHAVAVIQSTTCPSCGSPMRPHYACPSCGKYRGRDVLKLQAKVEKKIAGKTKPAKAAKVEKAEKKAASKAKTAEKPTEPTAETKA
jgi:large subunit ribosomal protein L32